MSRESISATIRRLEIEDKINIGCGPDDVTDDVMTEIAHADPAQIPARVRNLIYALCNSGICLCDGEDDIIAAARS